MAGQPAPCSLCRQRVPSRLGCGAEPLPGRGESCFVLQGRREPQSCGTVDGSAWQGAPRLPRCPNHSWLQQGEGEREVRGAERDGVVQPPGGILEGGRRGWYSSTGLELV